MISCWKITAERKKCDFCPLFQKAPLNKWQKFDLPFKVLCEEHDKKVKNSPYLLKINKEAIRVIKPWPRLMFGSNGYGKIRFKSYFIDVSEGITPSTWWANYEWENPYIELKNMIGITLKEPKIEKIITLSCPCPKNDDFPLLKASLGTNCLNCFYYIDNRVK